jgi:Xaa-Pro aminopeptidase
MKTQSVVDLDRVHRAMAEQQLDALIVNHGPNVWYFSGYPLALSGLQGRGYGRNASVIVPVKGDPILVPGFFEEQISRARAWAAEIEPFSDYIQVPVAAAAQVLQRRGLPHRRVGIELNHLSERFHRALWETLPDTDWVAADEMLDGLRAVKSSAEIAGIENTLRRSAEGVKKGLAAAKAGDREIDLHNRLVESMIRAMWSEKIDGSLLCGPRVPLWNAQVSDRPIASGDWIRLDYTTMLASFPARLSRMGVAGQPSAAQEGAFRRYAASVRQALEKVTPGMTGADAHTQIVDGLQASGVDVVEDAAGFGLGYGPVERPYLTPGETWKLQQGMALSVEPRTRSGLQASWLVVIGEKTARVVDSPLPPDELFVVQI